MAAGNPETPAMEPDPRARLMHEVAAQMDSLEASFPDGFKIGRVITVIEVAPPDGDMGLRVRANMYPWVALGMLRAAQRVVEAGGGPPLMHRPPEDAD